jgi:hypothetical protein
VEPLLHPADEAVRRQQKHTIMDFVHVAYHVVLLPLEISDDLGQAFRGEPVADANVLGQIVENRVVMLDPLWPRLVIASPVRIEDALPFFLLGGFDS